jgi:hypothetical protein
LTCPLVPVQVPIYKRHHIWLTTLKVLEFKSEEPVPVDLWLL